ncbi:MAG: CPBP family intramembrane metalloprotease [Clostridia bacterium]|nr:CPBP family intramembrane metalloprotease [Clostridia bacterium]
MAEKKLRLKWTTVAEIVLLAGCVVLEFGKFAFTGDSVHDLILNTGLTRLLAGVFFLLLIKESGLRVFSWTPAGEFATSVLLTLPALLVAVNNLPAISLATGDCGITDTPLWVAIFFVQCMCVGFFEELAFRGLLFPYFLKKCKTRLHVFLCIAGTSCLFGLYHLLNLLEGAGIGPVLRQVGYSALVGAMCAACMLLTGNVVVPVILHGVYNFCGLVVPTLGGGTWWDVPTIVITVVLAVAATAYFAVVFVRKKSFRLLDALGIRLENGERRQDGSIPENGKGENDSDNNKSENGSGAVRKMPGNNINVAEEEKKE